MNENGSQADDELGGVEAIPPDELYTKLDDELRAELQELLGLKALGIEVWEDSLGDEEDEGPVRPEERIFFDCDLFLEENQALELYIAAVYPDPDADPVQGMDAIVDILGELADGELGLLDFDDADDEGGLALAFGHGEHVHLVVVASAWMVSEWESEEESGEG